MNTRRLTALFLAAFLITALLSTGTGKSWAQAAGPRCYVDDDAGGVNTGVDWQNAYTDLQSALHNLDCKEVWVAAGIYRPGVPGDRAATFQLRNNLELFGGFAGTETALEQRDWDEHITVLSGDIDANDHTDPHGVVTDTVNIVGENSSNVVTFVSYVDWTAVVDGLTITAGFGNGEGYPNYLGAGLFNNGGHLYLTNLTFSGNRANGYEGGGINNSGELFVSNSTFTHNKAYIGGGGISNHYGSLTVNNSIFSGNAALDGGGILNRGTLTVTNSTFSENSAADGAGIQNGGGADDPYPNSDAKLIVRDSTFTGNIANRYGGGISNNTATTIVWNSTFSGNIANDGYYDNSGLGGGIINHSGALTVTNSTFSGNSGDQYGGGIYNATGTINLVNTMIANSPSGGNCSGSITDGGGNLSFPDTTCPGVNSDPKLGPLQDNGGPTLTHALLPGSPAIDTANPAACPPTDQRGLLRPFDGDMDGTPEYDMGSFEWIANESIHYPPTISGIPDLKIKDDISNFAISFRIDDPDTPLPSLILSKESSNQTLMPIDHILLGGSGTNRIIHLSPVENLSGSTTITVTVSDGQLATSESFLVTVNPNNAPVLADIGDQTGMAYQPVTFTASASDVDGDILSYSLDPGAPTEASIDPKTGVFTWTPTTAGTFNVTVRVSDHTLEDFETFAIAVNSKIYLPVSVRAPARIVGTVTLSGRPAAGIDLYLRFYNGSSWSTQATTKTDANGNYLFTNFPALAPGQLYYVRYANETNDENKLSSWWTKNITSDMMVDTIHAGNFDLANITHRNPAPGATVSLPASFSWYKRDITPSDRYELYLFLPYADSPYFFTGPLGFVDQYTLTSLPNGFQNGTVYGWFMAVYSPDGGYGESYYYYEVTFSGGHSPIIPSIDSWANPLLFDHPFSMNRDMERPTRP